jgi:hypothetical protein
VQHPQERECLLFGGGLLCEFLRRGSRVVTQWRSSLHISRAAEGVQRGSNTSQTHVAIQYLPPALPWLTGLPSCCVPRCVASTSRS